MIMPMPSPSTSASAEVSHTLMAADIRDISRSPMVIRMVPAMGNGR